MNKNKKMDQHVSNLLLYLAIISFLFTFVYGLFYYREIKNNFLYVLAVIQNSIKAFTFQSDISFDDLVEYMTINKGLAYKVLVYCYGISCFTAPYCTLSFCYKLIQKFTRLKLFVLRKKKDRHVIIFGYNAGVKALLTADDFNIESSVLSSSVEEKCKIHLVVSCEISDSEIAEWNKKNIMIHSFDLLMYQNEEKQINSFLKQIEIGLARDIILFEDSSSKNFSLYHFFQGLKGNNDKENSEILRKDVKFYCRCEDDGVKRIIEDYHDRYLENSKFVSDLETVSIPELRIRKMLKENPLHSYYLDGHEPDPNKWNLYLLIIGFGNLGQQLLLQAMNLGVTGSENRIVIDIIDNDVKKKKSIFENHFDENYVTIDADRIIIGSDKADGTFEIRFHQMDIRYKQFSKKLDELGKEGFFTYVAVCVENLDVSLHCMSEVKRHMDRCQEHGMDTSGVKLAIRMEFDKQMEYYVNVNHDTFENVFSIESIANAISLRELIEARMDVNAKIFNHTYNMITIHREKASEKTDAEAAEKEKMKEASHEWQKLTLFRRDASRAIAQRTMVNADVMRNVSDEQLQTWVGENGSLLQYRDGRWNYGISDKEFAHIQSRKYREVSELSRMEHRRWCYYTASQGWRCTPSPDMEKDDKKRQNPCLCTWNSLEENLPEYCIYDLMPMLYEYLQRRTAKQKH